MYRVKIKILVPISQYDKILLFRKFQIYQYHILLLFSIVFSFLSNYRILCVLLILNPSTLNHFNRVYKEGVQCTTRKGTEEK